MIELEKYLDCETSWSNFDANAKWEKENTRSFGIDFLDDALDGLSPRDLVLVSGFSGGGKSECATIIAEQAALTGKRVTFFALEAEQNEIAYRIAYRKFMAEMYHSKSFGEYDCRYSQFIRGEPELMIRKHRWAIDNHMQKISNNLRTHYPPENFTVDDMNRSLEEAKSISDMIIIDHLHYFDLDDQNENAAMKAIVLGLRQFVLARSIPVILVAHIRKQNEFFQKLVPNGDDIHGSSDTLKICTKAIMLSSGWNTRFVDEDGDEVSYPKTTLIRAVKSRRDGSLPNYIGALRFAPQHGGYESGYLVGRPYKDKNGLAFQLVEDLPKWAKSAKRPVARV